MDLIFLGGEVPSHRNLLVDSGVKHIGVNFWRLMKRGLPKNKEYLLAERFPDDVRIYVDGGGYHLNKEKLSLSEIEDYAADYEDWVAINEDRIFMATELDSKALGSAWIQEQRKTFWEDFGTDRFIAVWHQDLGYPALMSLSQTYPHVGILGETINTDLTLSARARAFESQYGVSFHGLACSTPDNLRQVPLKTASTLAWISPMMRGETIVWDGTRLVRYQAKMKDQARPRYKSIVEKANLDFDLILSDDSNEVTKLAIWSYLQLEASLSKIKGRTAEEIKTLPVFSLSSKTIIDKDGEGRDVIKDASVVENSGVSLRQCNTCFVAANCPAMKPDSACAFNLPLEVKTKEQLKALLNAIIEMQGSRVAFSRFAEELNGGYPDPNTGQEIDRLFKLVKQLKELEENKEFVRITAERQTSGGVLSALFGERANTLRQLPNNGLNEEQTTKIISDSLE